jgi:predicted lipid-binding transport protein (Tim44 family)
MLTTTAATPSAIAAVEAGALGALSGGAGFGLSDGLFLLLFGEGRFLLKFFFFELGVLVNLAGFFDDAQHERLLATYRPQFPALEQAAPELARVMIPIIEAYPATVARLRQVDIPPATPTIDIVAERTWVDTPEEVDAIRRAHRDFVAASSHGEPSSRRAAATM